MKSITIFNNKGGVGKTTFLCNLASYIAKDNAKKVLIIDADPQCNASIYLMDDQEVENVYSERKPDTIYKVIDPLKKGKGYIEKNAIPIKESKGFNVNFIAGDPELSTAEDFLSKDWIDCKGGDERGLRTTFVFRDLLMKLQEFDYIFFDVGPALGAINRAVLLSTDYFLIPMSSDIFSLKAVENIAKSLEEWLKSAKRGLSDYSIKNREPFRIEDKNVVPNPCFAGYIYQQYTAKMKQNVVRPVKAYEKIIKHMPSMIERELKHFYGVSPQLLCLGKIPNLSSLVPLSQNAHKSIFDLKSQDGVVGAHFAKVHDFESILKEIKNNLLRNISDDTLA